MNQEAIKEVKGNGKVEVSRDTIDLIKGLKTMVDLDTCDFLLQRLRALVRMVDDISEGEMDEFIDVITICHWQYEIIDKIKSILQAQDDMVMTLKAITYRAEEEAGIPFAEADRFKVDERKLTALRALEHIFSGGASNTDIKGWAVTYGYDFGMVKAVLGNIPSKETQRQAARKLQELGVDLKEFERKEGIKIDLPEEEKAASETAPSPKDGQGQE